MRILPQERLGTFTFIGILVLLGATAVSVHGQPAAASLPDTARISEKLYGLPGLANVGRVSPGVYRGAQPRPEGYATLRKMGIRTVINLRARHSERQQVEAAGMKYIEIPFGMMSRVRKEEVLRIVAAMSDPANQPVFLHCALGRDRTGLAAAVYRMEHDGWPAADALQEMQDFGFNDVWIHIRKFLQDYARGKEGGRS